MRINLTNSVDARAAEIRERYAKLMDEIVKPYHPIEQKTWDVQLKEADEWLSDSNIPTPMLSGIAQGRGISVAELVSKVKENDSTFRVAVGYYLGKQQAELDALYA